MTQEAFRCQAGTVEVTFGEGDAADVEFPRLLRAAEDHVAALQVSNDVGVAEIRHQLTQPGHCNLLVAADVDSAKKRDERRGPARRSGPAPPRWSTVRDFDIMPSRGWSLLFIGVNRAPAALS